MDEGSANALAAEKSSADCAIGGDTADLCPVHWLIRRLGDRWSLAIICVLRAGPMRFARLKKALSTVSHRILALSLRKLERDGLISRSQQPTVPPQVTYTLSALGLSLVAQLEGLAAWVRENSHEIATANAAFDRGTRAASGDAKRPPGEKDILISQRRATSQV